MGGRTSAHNLGLQRSIAIGDLAPEFIAVVPTDPFDGKPLKFKKIGQGAIVSSIGPKTTDKRAEPLFHTDKKHRGIAFTVPDQGPAKKLAVSSRKGARASKQCARKRGPP